MRWLLSCLVHLVGVACGRLVQPQVSSDTSTPATATSPDIYRCRSPNMEYFTCWWHPVANVSDSEEVSYTLHYNKDKGPVHECPDYVSGGAHSCHFDSGHTSIWKVYCMMVSAVVAGRWNATSQPYCMDVADIVQTEAPVNVTYALREAGGDEMGHSALVAWSYPAPQDLQYGWITLVYELQYRRLTEPHNWKVKQAQRESRLELVGLPVGGYLVRVRCRSHNYGLWSKWSSPLHVNIPARPPAGKMLVLILVVGIGVAMLLVIAFGVIPQAKRIKALFLPPIPKPRIEGIDPLLLKKGKLDEIDHHLRTFHGFARPVLGEEAWHYISEEDGFTAAPPSCALWPERPAPGAVDAPPPPAANPNGRDEAVTNCPDEAPPLVAPPATTPPSAVMTSPYCGLPPPKFPDGVPSVATGEWAWPAAAVPLSDYSQLVAAPLPPALPAAPSPPVPPQDFYTRVQLLSDTGQVKLVPCLTPPTAAGPEDEEEEEEEVEVKVKRRRLADYLAATPKCAPLSGC